MPEPVSLLDLRRKSALIPVCSLMRLLPVMRKTGGSNRHPHTLKFKRIAYVKVDDGFAEHSEVNGFRWTLNGKDGYPVRWNGKETIFLHREVVELAGIPVPAEVDHKDRDKLNAQLDNLRPANAAEDNANRGLRKDSTSGLAGISWRPSKGHYEVRVRFQGKMVYNVCFKDRAKAKEARDREARKYHKEFAVI